MAGSSEPAFSFEYKKGAIAPWMITHLFCNSPFLFKKNIAKKNCICYNADRLRDTIRPQLARQEMSKLFPL